MIKLILLAFVVLAAACSSIKTDSKHSQNKSWIEKSNALATEFALSNAIRYPENASSIGFEKYDPMVTQLEDDMETEDRAFLFKWQARLVKELQSGEKDENYLTDVRVLLNILNVDIQNISIEDKYPEADFCPTSRSVYSSLRELINDQTSSKRKKAAAVRFKGYVYGQGRFKPFTDACRSRLEYLEKKYGRAKMIQPLKQEVEQYLNESPQYLEGISALLKESGSADWKVDFDEFQKQMKMHDKYIKTRILPKARTTYQIPRELYIANIRSRSIDATPEELIRVARADFKTGLKTFQDLAKKVALKYNLPKHDPISVLKYLKQDQVTKPGEVKKLYEDANIFLTQILRENDLITIPKSALKIRLAGEAESEAAPFPHLNAPQLIGNTGQRPEFVLPTALNGGLPFDDFSYRASATMITAHEGRPGHDLQFGTMLDTGVSLIRARYAFNNVNVEGWALYAEEIVFSFVPVEAQFGGMQTRLLRIARMFLDPEVSLGKIGKKGVIKTLMGKVGTSNTLANLEFQRYAFDDPGQAPSYYFGLKRMLQIKKSLKDRLGTSFTEKCFNDGVVSLGLLPLDLIDQILQKSLSCTPSH